MDKKKRKAIVLPAKCKKNSALFGIRAEQIETIWSFTWTFPLIERTSENEHLADNKVSGNVMFDHDYPGCPHCGNPGIVVCGNCGRTSCVEMDAREFKCPWCHASGKLNFTNSVEGIKGGGY